MHSKLRDYQLKITTDMYIYLVITNQKSITDMYTEEKEKGPQTLKIVTTL